MKSASVSFLPRLVLPSAWQINPKHQKAWLFFGTLLCIMGINYAVIFATLKQSHQGQDRLLLNQLVYLANHKIQEGSSNFDDLAQVDFQGRMFEIVLFAPNAKAYTLSNTSNPAFTNLNNWQLSQQQTATLVQSGRNLEALQPLADDYRIYVHLQSPSFYSELATPLNLLPLLLFLLSMASYLWYLNREKTVWQDLIQYCQHLPLHTSEPYQPFPVPISKFNLEVAQLTHAINRFGYQIHRYLHQMQSLQQHQQLLVESMPLPLFLINRKGQMGYFNPQFSKQFMTPFHADALYMLSDFVAGKDKPTQQQLANLNRVYGTLNLVVTDLQHSQFFDLRLQPVYNRFGKLQGFSGCLEIVSGYHAQLQEAWLIQKQQQDKLASFDKLWAVLGHELRTPLSGMLGMIEVLDEDKDSMSADQQEALLTLQQSGQGMLQMLNDMLDIAKMDAGKLHTNMATVDLFGLMRQVADLMLGNARRQNIDLLYHIDGQVPRYLETDDGRLRQILLNLLSNAIKFTKQGYVAMLADLVDDSHPIIQQRVGSNQIIDAKDATAHHKWLCLTVKDTGMGISEAEQKKLFSFFNQANESISRQFGGTGLGLAISNSFSHLLGGFIHLTSVVGQGSEFQLFLPLPHFQLHPIHHFNGLPYPVHLILILKYAVSKQYIDKLFTRLQLNFSAFVGTDRHVIAQINQLAVIKNTPPALLPIFIIDDHCYYEDTEALASIHQFDTHKKILVTMDAERSITPSVLEKFDGLLPKPTPMNSVLAEIARVYANNQPTSPHTTTPLTAQQAYGQFLSEFNQPTTVLPQPDLNVPLSLALPTVDINFSPNLPMSKLIPKSPLQNLVFSPVSKATISKAIISKATRLSSPAQNLTDISQHQKSILVAEDNVVNQKVATRHLNKLGYNVLIAQDGNEAIALLTAHRQEIGLILMDCRMPNLDGLAATRLIRAQQDSIPIIALTANDSDDDRNLCLQAGMDNFLTKPFNKTQLLALLNRYMI